VAAYLRQRRFSFVYEPSIRGRNPDFVVDTNVGRVALEVFAPRLHLPAKSGSFDSVAPVLGAFEKRKRKQIGAAVDEGLPAILVVASTNSDVPFDEFAIGGAMFGRPGIRFRLGHAEEAISTFLGPGRTQPQLNTSYSAMALVRRFNPTLWRLRLAWSTLLRSEPGTKSSRALGETFVRRQEVESELTNRGIFDPSAALARFIVLHNPYARVPLPLEFAGMHDEQYSVVSDDDDGALWRCISEGRLMQEVVRD
jgi:hypothetical protein